MILKKTSYNTAVALFLSILFSNITLQSWGQAKNDSTQNPSISIEQVLDYFTWSKKRIERELLWMPSVVKYRIKLEGKRLISMYDYDSEVSAYFSRRRVFEISVGNYNGQIDTTDGKFTKWIEQLGPDFERLDCAAGIQYGIRVYPEKGIAFTTMGPQRVLVDLQIFHPMSIEEYKKYFWTDPGDMYDGTIE